MCPTGTNETGASAAGPAGIEQHPPFSRDTGDKTALFEELFGEVGAAVHREVGREQAAHQTPGHVIARLSTTTPDGATLSSSVLLSGDHRTPLAAALFIHADTDHMVTVSVVSFADGGVVPEETRSWLWATPSAALSARIEALARHSLGPQSLAIAVALATLRCQSQPVIIRPVTGGVSPHKEEKEPEREEDQRPASAAIEQEPPKPSSVEQEEDEAAAVVLNDITEKKEEEEEKVALQHDDASAHTTTDHDRDRESMDDRMAEAEGLEVARDASNDEIFDDSIGGASRKRQTHDGGHSCEGCPLVKRLRGELEEEKGKSARWKEHYEIAIECTERAADRMEEAERKEEEMRVEKRKAEEERDAFSVENAELKAQLAAAAQEDFATPATPAASLGHSPAPLSPGHSPAPASPPGHSPAPASPPAHSPAPAVLGSLAEDVARLRTELTSLLGKAAPLTAKLMGRGDARISKDFHGIAVILALRWKRLRAAIALGLARLTDDVVADPRNYLAIQSFVEDVRRAKFECTVLLAMGRAYAYKVIRAHGQLGHRAGKVRWTYDDYGAAAELFKERAAHFLPHLRDAERSALRLPF